MSPDEKTEAQSASPASPEYPGTPAPSARTEDNTIPESPPAPPDSPTVFQPAEEAAQARAKSDPSIRVEGTQQESSEDRQRAATASKQCAYRVPGYQILEKLGEGTYGEVWHAREHSSGIEVAIKFFNRGTNRDWLRLQDEVKQLALLHADPGIVQLKDVDAEARPPYFVMAYAAQRCLAQRLKKGPVPVPEAVAILRHIAQALAYVHAKGIRHCDLKPGNILLDALGKPRVADFGQAHLASDLSPALGTFFYMAPEQADLANQIPDTRWDVYALGALFHAMVVGEPPRRGKTIDGELSGAAELAERLRRYRAHVLGAPRPRAHHRVRGLSGDLARLIDQCLAINPAERPRDAAAVLAALDRIERRRRRRPYLVFALAAPVLLLSLIGLLGYWEGKRALTQSDDALRMQLGKSDLTSARLVAYKVKDQLNTRIQANERWAKQPEIRTATAKGDVAELQKLLAMYYGEAMGRGDNNALAGVALFAADGRGLAVYAEAKVTDVVAFRTSQYTWRDYFSGRGDQLEHTDQVFPPIQDTHISQPFVSRVTADGMLIGISTPIFGLPDNAKTVGVLLATVRLERLNDWLQDVSMEHGFAVLINDKRQVLYHKEQEAIRPGYRKPPKAWPECEVYNKVLSGQADHEMYTDPVDGRTYVAGYAPITDEKIHWGVLVQHEYDKVKAPITELRSELVSWSLVMLAAAIVLVLGLGAGLLWLLRREEGAAHA